MLPACSRFLALTAFAFCTAAMAQSEVAVTDLSPGDRVEVRGNIGQSYLLTVRALRDGVLHGRCLRSGSEFRGEVSAITAVQRLSVNPRADMTPLVALIGSGLNSGSTLAQ